MWSGSQIQASSPTRVAAWWWWRTCILAPSGTGSATPRRSPPWPSATMLRSWPLPRAAAAQPPAARSASGMCLGAPAGTFSLTTTPPCRPWLFRRTTRCSSHWGTTVTAPWPCGAWPPASSCPPSACRSQRTAWPSTPGMPESSPAWAKVPSPRGSCSNAGLTSPSRCQGSEVVVEGGVWLSPGTLPTPAALVSLQVHREPIPEEVGAGELTSLCYGAAPLLYCGSNAGRVCVWDTRAGRCFLAWEADDGEIGVLLCSGARLVSGSNTRRLRLWAVGAVPELRRKGARARSSSVFMEHELTLDGAIVSAVFHDSMDMGVVGTTAGTLWYVGWAEGTSTRLISGHRSKVNEVVFSPSASHWATCSDDGSVRVWSLAGMELLTQFQVLNQSCLCLAWSPPSCGRPEEQQVAAGYSDGTLRVFSVSQIAMELKMRPHRAALTAIAFSADGQTILSGDKDGLVAASRPRTGMTFHVLSDHRGAPISTIQSTNKECGDLGAEGADLWLAASSDQRISVWASDWPRGRCELLDWLSCPSPTLTEFPSRPPPCLVAFCPWDGALLACAGLGVHPEVVFYSLHQKQVVEKIPLPFFAVSLSLSPGAHLMAIGFAERMLRLVDCESGAVQDFAGHDDWVQLCRFAPSAQLLFSAAHSEILVWEVSGHLATEESLGSGSWPPWRRS